MSLPNLFQSLGYVYFSYKTPLSIVAKFYAHGGIVLTSQDPYSLPVDIYFVPPGDRLASYLMARELVVHDPCWVDACVVEGRLVDLTAWVVECPHSVTAKTRRGTHRNLTTHVEGVHNSPSQHLLPHQATQDDQDAADTANSFSSSLLNPVQANISLQTPNEDDQKYEDTTSYQMLPPPDIPVNGENEEKICRSDSLELPKSFNSIVPYDRIHTRRATNMFLSTYSDEADNEISNKIIDDHLSACRSAKYELDLRLLTNRRDISNDSCDPQKQEYEPTEVSQEENRHTTPKVESDAAHRRPGGWKVIVAKKLKFQMEQQESWKNRGESQEDRDDKEYKEESREEKEGSIEDKEAEVRVFRRSTRMKKDRTQAQECL